jgi:DNA polymerase-1
MMNAKFDLTQLGRWTEVVRRDKLWDIMLVDRILYGGYFEKFALTDLVRRHLNILLEKDARGQFETATELTPELLEYSAKDPYYTLKVCQVQRKLIFPNEFEVWREVDLPALWAIKDFKGFRLDVEKWTELAERNAALAQEYKETFELNPASPKQVKAKLLELGARVTSTSADVLEDLIKKNPESEVADVAERVLNYRKKAKLSSTYGLNWIKKYVEEDDCVYSDYYVTGASTGRTSSSKPNCQNIPIRETPEFRECFIPKEGNSLIVADYSAQEPRILAYFSQDEKMVEICNSGKDIYIETVKLMYGREITRDDPFRDEAKEIILAAGYGLSAYGYSQRYDVTKKEAEERLGTFFKIFPGIKNWTYKQELNHKYVETVLGRKFHLNPYSYQRDRHTRNAPIQGTAGDQLKVALGALHKNWPKGLCEYGIVAEIHDEIIADVPKDYAKEISQIIQKTMERVANEMCPGVSFMANVAVCETWAGGK